MSNWHSSKFYCFDFITIRSLSILQSCFQSTLLISCHAVNKFHMHLQNKFSLKYSLNCFRDFLNFYLCSAWNFRSSYWLSLLEFFPSFTHKEWITGNIHSDPNVKSGPESFFDCAAFTQNGCYFGHSSLCSSIKACSNSILQTL